MAKKKKVLHSADTGGNSKKASIGDSRQRRKSEPKKVLNIWEKLGKYWSLYQRG